MPVPRNRHSNARKNSRRAHDARSASTLHSCKNCGEKCLPHHMCSSCGFYAGKAVVVEKRDEEQSEE